MEHAIRSLFNTALFCLLAGATLAQADTVRSRVELDGIENIHLLGPYHLVVSQGDEEYVTIIADRDEIDAAEARIKGGTLALGHERESFWQRLGDKRAGELRFEVQVSRLKYLVNRGSGTVVIRPLSSDGELALKLQGSGGVKADSLEVESLSLGVMGSGTAEINRLGVAQLTVRIHGSGDVELGELYPRHHALGASAGSKAVFAANGSGDIRVAAGQLSSLDVSVRGSGDVNAAQLQVREAKVSIYGSGDVELNVREALDVRINGSGDLRYRGQPTNLQRAVKGSGNVQQLN